MAEVFLGILILLALVGFQAGLQFWNVHRTRVAWQGAQEQLQLDDLVAAEKSLAKCVKLQPLWLQARMLYGAVLSQRGKLADAEEHLKLAAELEPETADGHVELGIFYVTSANRIEEGLTAFRTALACDDAVRGRLNTDARLREFRDSPAYAELAE
jgi:tetratricopeptide (TPR) repeat protein